MCRLKDVLVWMFGSFCLHTGWNFKVWMLTSLQWGFNSFTRSNQISTFQSQCALWAISSLSKEKLCKETKRGSCIKKAFLEEALLILLNQTAEVSCLSWLNLRTHRRRTGFYPPSLSLKILTIERFTVRFFFTASMDRSKNDEC